MSSRVSADSGMDIGEFAASYQQAVTLALGSIDLNKVARAVEILAEARDRDGMIFVCGNGGSASTASHFVCDMVKGASFGHASRFRIMALTDSLPTITAYSNDVGYESVFVEQLKNFAKANDVLMTISGSGNSPNILLATEYANSIGCKTIALTGGDGGKLGPAADLEIRVTEPHIGRIEDCHIVVCHIISFYFMQTA
jgi:D-sedoheptulose 7-phosphate isomerase